MDMYLRIGFQGLNAFGRCVVRAGNVHVGMFIDGVWSENYEISIDIISIIGICIAAKTSRTFMIIVLPQQQQQ